MAYEDRRKAAGWFSRRYKTSEAHVSAQLAKEAHVEDFFATIKGNAVERAGRSNAEQIAVLDKRLGIDVGAKKERTRLLTKIANEVPQPKKRVRKR